MKTVRVIACLMLGVTYAYGMDKAVAVKRSANLIEQLIELPTSQELANRIEPSAKEIFLQHADSWVSKRQVQLGYLIVIIQQLLLKLHQGNTPPISKNQLLAVFLPDLELRNAVLRILVDGRYPGYEL